MVGKIGDSYIGRALDHTVEEFNPKVTTRANSETWQAVMIKTCAKMDGAEVTSFWWYVVDDNSGRYGNAGSYYDDAPKPLYPMGQETLSAGDCVRGWVLFDADASVKVTELRYGDEQGVIARWRL